ncbi:MAG: hypothetical protein RLY35_818 [Bacteroidota bacterium]|jgi:hypothetical protein
MKRALDLFLVWILLVSPMMMLAQSLPSYLPANGLVGWWPFNGNANDESGNGNHLLNSNVTFTSDRFGNQNATAAFNGIELGQGSTLTTQSPLFNIGQPEFTIGLWVKIADLNQVTRCLFNTIPHTGIAIGYNDNNAPGYFVYDLGPANAFWTSLYMHGSTTGYNTTSWYYLVLKKIGIQYFFYINGNLEHSSDNPSASAYNYDVNFRISGISPEYQIFNGLIDDLHLYNRALSAQEIQSLYNSQNPTIPNMGCLDVAACNYNASATLDDGSCTYPTQTYLNCDGTCIYDSDADGICNELEAPALPSYLPTNGLVGYWPFNGNANDESGNGNNGTVNGATLTTDRNGNGNSAYNFDGNDWIGSISLPYGAYSSSLGISFWMKTNSIMTNSGVLGKWNNSGPNNEEFAFVICESCGGMNFCSKTSYQVCKSEFNNEYRNDFWHFYVGTWDGNVVKLYRDGIEIQSENFSGTISNFSQSLEFGRYTGGAGPELYYNGILDDIAIYNRAITPEEITALYTGTSSNNGGGGTAGTPAASVPAGIPYQAVIRDNAGTALVNAPVTVRFTLHQNTTDGTVEYQETQSLTTNSLGLINTQFGSGAATQGTFANINWSNTTKFIQVEANTGAGYIDMGTQQMMSVPFAIKSNESNKIKNAGLPVYADNAAALAGGLTPGEMYRTANGDLKIVF